MRGRVNNSQIFVKDTKSYTSPHFPNVLVKFTFLWMKNPSPSFFSNKHFLKCINQKEDKQKESGGMN